MSTTVGEEDESIRDLKQQLQLRLDQSGMTSVIRKLVEEVCMSKDDPLSTNPDEVLQAIYNRGLMKNVMKEFSSVNIVEPPLPNIENPELHIENQHIASYRSDKDHGVSMLGSDHDLSRGCATLIGNLSDEPTEIQSSGRKYYLKLDILGGKAFLDHLSHDEGSLNYKNFTPKLVIHAFYKSQRFTTKPVDSCCDPHFKDVFMIDIGYFQNGSVAQLLTIKEPLRIVVVREDVNLHITGGGSVLSFTLLDWRSVLLTDNGIESFTLELMGTGPEHSIPVGLLNVSIKLLPTPDEQVSENTYLSQINTEQTNEEEQSRSFLTYTKLWWKDFLDIRPTNVLRHVKIFAYDDRMISRSVTSLVEPLRSDNVLTTPFQAAWFTALLPVKDTISTKNMLGNVAAGNIDHWQSLDITLASKQGAVEDHAILLCSLFLGFGLNAFVGLGTKTRKGKLSTWAWTVTFDNSWNPTFWESTTGKRYNHLVKPDFAELPDERVLRVKTNSSHKFETIGCLFDNESFFANIQSTDSVNLIDWNILDPSKWKRIPKKQLEKLPRISRYSPSIRGTTLDCLLITKNIEANLKMRFTEARLRENLTTRWDDTLSKIMGQQLATYELESSTGASNLENFFEVVVMKYIPSGYDFKGFPFQTESIDPRKIFHSCIRDPRCQDVVFCRGDNVHLSLRVMTFAYPENVASVRLMISCKFLSTD